MFKIIDNEGKEIARATLIAKYFRNPEETTKEYMDGCKNLTDADKDELARLVAKELGYTVVELK